MYRELAIPTDGSLTSEKRGGGGNEVTAGSQNERNGKKKKKKRTDFVWGGRMDPMSSGMEARRIGDSCLVKWGMTG